MTFEDLNDRIGLTESHIESNRKINLYFRLNFLKI